VFRQVLLSYPNEQVEISILGCMGMGFENSQESSIIN